MDIHLKPVFIYPSICY